MTVRDEIKDTLLRHGVSNRPNLVDELMGITTAFAIEMQNSAEKRLLAARPASPRPAPLATHSNGLRPEPR